MGLGAVSLWPLDASSSHRLGVDARHRVGAGVGDMALHRRLLRLGALPHHAHYRSDRGLYYRGSSVAIGFDFGLGWNHFTFIASDRFVDSNPHSHYLPASRVQNIYQQTTVINNYNTINNTVINNGIPSSHIPAVARQEVRKVSVQEWNPATQTQIAPDRIQQSGATPVIYRPQTPKAVAQAAENPNSRVHSELAKRAIVTTEQRLAIPASSITTTGQRLGTPASSITTTGQHLGTPASSIATTPQRLGTPAGSITTTPQRPLVTPAPSGNPTGQPLGTPASSITTTGQRLGTPASGITTTGQTLGTPAGTITTTPQRPLVTPATPATPGTAHQATKPVTPAVSANPRRPHRPAPQPTFGRLNNPRRPDWSSLRTPCLPRACSIPTPSPRAPSRRGFPSTPHHRHPRHRGAPTRPLHRRRVSRRSRRFIRLRPTTRSRPRARAGPSNPSRWKPSRASSARPRAVTRRPAAAPAACRRARIAPDPRRTKTRPIRTNGNKPLPTNPGTSHAARSRIIFWL